MLVLLTGPMVPYIVPPWELRDPRGRQALSGETARGDAANSWGLPRGPLRAESPVQTSGGARGSGGAATSLPRANSASCRDRPTRCTTAPRDNCSAPGHVQGGVVI